MTKHRKAGAAGHCFTPDMIDQAKRAYEAGATLATIGLRFGVSPQTIHYHLKSQVKMRKVGGIRIRR